MSDDRIAEINIFFDLMRLMVGTKLLGNQGCFSGKQVIGKGDSKFRVTENGRVLTTWDDIKI